MEKAKKVSSAFDKKQGGYGLLTKKVAKINSFCESCEKNTPNSPVFSRISVSLITRREWKDTKE